MCDAAEWRHEPEFESCQHMNVKGRRFVKWHNSEMSAIPPRGRDVSHQAVRDVWADCGSPRAFDILTPVVFGYMRDKAQSGTGSERELTQMTAKVVYYVLSLRTFLPCLRYGLADCFSLRRKVSDCEGGSALLYVPFESNKSWYALGIWWLIRISQLI